MKDHVFSGGDVASALTEASRTLGLPEGALRYVVLDAGAPGVRGLACRPARIVVLLDRPGLAVPPGAAAAAPADPVTGLRTVLAAVGDALEERLQVDVEDSPDAVVVHLSGSAARRLLEGEGEALRALEHLVQRMFGRALEPRRLSLDCEGYREVREEGLRTLARSLAEAVRADGTPRTTQPLNAYERRIVHITASAEPGIRTYSVGEGGGRRVTVAPAPPSPPDGAAEQG